MCVSKCVKKDETNRKSPSAEELLKKIQDLEARHALIRKLIKHQTSNSGPLASETHYLNVLQSTGRAVFICDLNHLIIFWNQGAENVYGYTAGEAIGRIPTELLTEPKDAPNSENILERTVNGESWCGRFPIKNKNGESCVVVGANTLFRDQNGRLVGAMCVLSDSRPYKVTKPAMRTSTASKISNLALKVKLKMKTRGAGETYKLYHSDNILQSIPRGHVAPSPFGGFFSTDSRKLNENKPEEPIVTDNEKEIASFDTIYGGRQTRSNGPAKLDCQNSTKKMEDGEILWEDLITKQQIGQGNKRVF